ncbi:MAG: hypothetical protein ACRDD8_15520 [Bacteroidales bacterium]
MNIGEKIQARKNTINNDLESKSLTEVYKALKTILLDIDDPTGRYGGKVFKSVQKDRGQLDRILSDQENDNDIVVFPACFIRFINVRYLVQQNKTNEGRCVARIRYVLNDLDTSTDDGELVGMQMFDIVNKAILQGKKNHVALSERCNLMYWDEPYSQNMLQAYWIDYEIYFRADSSYDYADWEYRQVITPAFTNWSDTDQPRPDDTSINIKDQTGFTEKL